MNASVDPAVLLRVELGEPKRPRIPEVLERAASPFPILLGSLDAIHLASALLVRGSFDELSLATNDIELGTPARAEGCRCTERD